MRAWMVLCLLAACGAGDDVSDGARAECASGGQLNDCPEAARTAEGACWRMVDCGAIAVSSVNQNGDHRFDWGVCVDGLDSATADRQRLIIDCIAASGCDQLRMNGSPGSPDPNNSYCLRLGGD